VTAEKVLHKVLRIQTRKDQTLEGKYGATQRTKRKRESEQKPQGRRQRDLWVKCRRCRKAKATNTNVEDEARRRTWRSQQSENFVNQRAGDVAEVLHLFDQDRESAIQRNKSPEEDWKPREHRPSKQLIPELMRTSFKREENLKTEL